MQHTQLKREESAESRTILRLYLLMISTVFLTACIVNITTEYYRPSAPEGEVVRALEPRTNSVILFERQDTIIGINTWVDTNDLYATISFEVPDDTQVKLLDNHLIISLDSRASWERKLSGRVWSGPGRMKEFPIDNVMIGKSSVWRFGTGKGLGQTSNAAYFFKALLFKKAENNSFKIRMPRFLVNNSEMRLPTIEFYLESEDLWTSLP